MKDGKKNPLSYCTDYYCCYGLKIQIFLISHTNFLGCSYSFQFYDQAAKECRALPVSLDSLLLGPYIEGNAVYTQSDKFITPFTGSQQLKSCITASWAKFWLSLRWLTTNVKNNFFWLLLNKMRQPNAWGLASDFFSYKPSTHNPLDCLH